MHDFVLVHTQYIPVADDSVGARTKILEGDVDALWATAQLLAEPHEVRAGGQSAHGAGGARMALVLRAPGDRELASTEDFLAVRAHSARVSAAAREWALELDLRVTRLEQPANPLLLFPPAEVEPQDAANGSPAGAQD